MSDPTTPAAVTAVPAAAPAPAAAAAPATPPVASPAAVVAVPATPPVETVADGDSLIPAEPPAAQQTEAEKLAAAQKLVKDAAEAADPNTGKAWLLNEGVMGTGEKPSWFKSDKYATVAKQAEAYPALEQRFGSFVGAPKDGKYDFKPPEGVEVKMDHPIMTEFTKWAASKQLSQDGYTELLGMLVQYEAAQQPNMAAIKQRLGENADSRISSVAQWGKANLGAEGFATLRAATSGANADAVFKVLEQVIAKTAQVRMPKPGADVPGASNGDGLAAIKARHGAKDGSGQLKVNTDPRYRAQIEKEYQDYYAGQGA